MFVLGAGAGGELGNVQPSCLEGDLEYNIIALFVHAQSTNHRAKRKYTRQWYRAQHRCTVHWRCTRRRHRLFLKPKEYNPTLRTESLCRPEYNPTSGTEKRKTGLSCIDLWRNQQYSSRNFLQSNQQATTVQSIHNRIHLRLQLRCYSFMQKQQNTMHSINVVHHAVIPPVCTERTHKAIRCSRVLSQQSTHNVQTSWFAPNCHSACMFMCVGVCCACRTEQNRTSNSQRYALLRSTHAVNQAAKSSAFCTRREPST